MLYWTAKTPNPPSDGRIFPDCFVILKRHWNDGRPSKRWKRKELYRLATARAGWRQILPLKNVS
jgi:hypothetical protein